MIVWILLCLQLIKLNGLIRIALRRTEQVDVWNQVHLHASWNEQTGNSKPLRPPLVREAGGFLMENSTMSNYIYDQNPKILLPLWERIQDELSKEENEKHENTGPEEGPRIIRLDGTSGTSAAENGRCVLDTPFINTVATGQNINRLRVAAGLSVRDMQMIFGFATPQAIYKWFHGTALPTIDNLVILADVLDVTMDEIIVVSRTAAKSG